MIFRNYKISNFINGKIYFGYTSKELSQRFREHIKESSGCKLLKRSICKYGKENFTIEQLYEFDNIYEAQTTEIYLIAINKTNICKYPDGNGMNMTDGGEGISGFTFSVEAREKLSKANKGNKKALGHQHSTETRKLISESNKRKIRSVESKIKYSHSASNRSKETLQKLSKSQTGKKMSNEARKKMSESKKGINHPKCRSVSQYTMAGDLLQIYPYIKGAGEQTNISAQNIYECCKGKSKSAGGFIWKYSEVK